MYPHTEGPAMFAGERCIMVRRILSVLILVWVAVTSFAAGEKDEPKPAQSIGELRQQLEEILKDTRNGSARANSAAGTVVFQ